MPTTVQHILKMPKHNCRFHNAPKSVLKSTIINNRINNSEGFLWKVYVVGIPTSIGFRMKLIQDYIYYDFISHAALRVKMIARFKKILKTKIFFSSMWIQLAASRRQNISPKKLTCSISRVPSKCLDRFTFPKSQTLKSVKWNYSFVCVYSRCIIIIKCLK